MDEQRKCQLRLVASMLLATSTLVGLSQWALRNDLFYRIPNDLLNLLLMENNNISTKTMTTTTMMIMMLLLLMMIIIITTTATITINNKLMEGQSRIIITMGTENFEIW